MDKIRIVTLEDDKDYQVVDAINYKNTEYLLLSKVNNNKEICIRKILIEDNEEYISRLKKEEFNIIVNMFVEKNKNLVIENK